MSLCRDCPHSKQKCTLDKCDKIDPSFDTVKDVVSNPELRLKATITAYKDLRMAMTEIVDLCSSTSYKDGGGEIADCVVDIIKDICRKHDKEDNRMVANETLCNTQAESED